MLYIFQNRNCHAMSMLRLLCINCFDYPSYFELKVQRSYQSTLSCGFVYADCLAWIINVVMQKNCPKDKGTQNYQKLMTSKYISTKIKRSEDFMKQPVDKIDKLTSVIFLSEAHHWALYHIIPEKNMTYTYKNMKCVLVHNRPLTYLVTHPCKSIQYIVWAFGPLWKTRNQNCDIKFTAFTDYIEQFF